MSNGSQRSGVPAWLVVGAAFAWFGRARRRAKEAKERAGTGSDRFLRRVVLGDGQEALQADVVLVEPDAATLGGWERVRIQSASSDRTSLLTTLAQPPELRGSGPIDVEGPGGEHFDLAAVLLPMGTRRRVNAVDCYVTGGLAGHLPSTAVARWGDQLRQVHLARGGQASAVPARIVRDDGPGGTGLLQLDVLMPPNFSAT
jgi:hypothetical protein